MRFVLLPLLLLTVGCSKPPAPQKEAVMPAPTSTNHFTGTLHGGVVAVGGDTTGWQLEREELPGTIDVNVSKVQDAAQKLDGQRVVIEGNIVTVTWVERGQKQLLIAERIEPAPAKP